MGVFRTRDLRDGLLPAWPAAWNHGLVSTRGVLIAWGAVAAVAAGVTLARIDGLPWALIVLAAYPVGVWTTAVQPANRAAAALLAVGCVGLTWAALSADLVSRVDANPAFPGFIALNAVVQAAGFLMVAAQVIALVRYPDGRRVYAVEDWLLRGMLLLAPLLPVVLLLTRPQVVPAWVVQYVGADGLLVPPSVESPWYVPAVGWLGPSADLVQAFLIVVGPVLGAVVAAARYVRMDTAARQRMAWPLLAVLVFVLGIGLSAVAEASGLPRWLSDGTAIASFMVLPIAMGIGIAAPQLFDALGTARRTLSYFALSALVLSVYVAVAGALGATVGGEDLNVAVVVAVVAALVLEPVRRTLVRLAERLAFGREVSRDELLLRLGETLERTLDRRALTESIAETAMEGLGAQWVRLELHDAAPVHVGRPLAAREEPVLSAPLLHGPTSLGRISCGPPAKGRPRSRSRIQLELLGRQVAMGLTNARLAEELEDQLSEIEASRQRLVSAEETARRRLERDLHDGAQQDLAALLARIALARSQLGRGDLERLDQTLATLHEATVETLQNLRELVSGIHETVLADQGLVAAVEGRAARLPIPVEVSCGPGLGEGRLPAAVESTAYFTVCEALANTLKHGAASRATIAIALEDDRLRIQVVDDGRGFDTSAVDGSSGLVGLRDRIAAVGGTLDVRSAPERGTTLTALVPTVP